MKINNVEVDFKISRLKDAEAMELAMQNMEKREGEVRALADKEDVKLTEVVGSTLDMLRDFFKEATGTDVLSGCEDVGEAVNAYQVFLIEMEKQKKVTLSLYSPDRVK